MNRLARVTLGGACAEELARPLSLLGIDCGIAAGGLDRLTTARIDGGGEVAAAARMAIGAHGDPRTADFVCDSVYPAACFILSRMLRMPAPMLTADSEMFSVLRDALALAPRRAPVLIEGETGVGKKSLARMIHAAGGGSDEPLYIDCAAIDDANEPFLLILEQWPERRANAPGTIILDRIAELPAAAQSRLIARMRASDGGASGATRFIATAGRSLIGTGRWQEFLAELRGLFEVTLAIPPLRRRRKDIAALARHFLRGISSATSLDADAIRALQEYPFPGNVRELHNLVTRLAILRAPSADDAGEPGREAITASDVRNQIALAYQAAGVDSIVWKLTRERVRREMARWALAAAGGDQYKAAAHLGVAPPAIIRLTAASAPKSRRLRDRSP